MRCCLRFLLSSLFLAGLAVSPARLPAVTLLTEGAVDIGLAYEDDAWDLHLHDESNDVEYDPHEARLYVGSLDPPPLQPAGAEWEFIGAGAGNEYCLLPAIETPGQISLGVGAEEVEPGTFLDYFEGDPRVAASGPWIRLTLRDVRGPGEFSMWSTDPFGAPIVWMSTYDGGITDDDALFTQAGGHDHYNVGFTAVGIYEVDFEATAFLPDGTPTASGPVTYRFGVKAVPEPGALSLASALAATAAVAGPFMRRRIGR